MDLLSLLDAYAGLVRRQQQDDPASLPSRLPALPPFPVCINTDALCGRQTDVLSAIAASVIQTRGTDQGYFLDLSPRPPAVAPLFNTSGWRYAAGVMAALLRHNPPAAASAAAAVETGGADGEGGPSCHGLSQTFNAGKCLLMFELDTALLMGTNVPALNKPGQIGVAPLPGSRMVAPPTGATAAPENGGDSSSGGGSSSGSGSGSGSRSRGAKYGLDERGLVPCTEELCGVSLNHDLLYLQPTLQGAEAAAAASSSANKHGNSSSGGSSSGGVLADTGDSPLLAFAKREREAAARLRASPRAAETPPLVNRAPYSVVLDWVLSVRYKGERGTRPWGTCRCRNAHIPPEQCCRAMPAAGMARAILRMAGVRRDLPMHR